MEFTFLKFKKKIETSSCTAYRRCAVKITQDIFFKFSTGTLIKEQDQIVDGDPETIKIKVPIVLH